KISKEEQVTKKQTTSLDDYFPMLEFSVSGKIMFANEKFLSKLNYTLDEISDSSYSSLIRHDSINTQGHHDLIKKLSSGAQ
ncbi:PAS domain-containing protein, partial [Mycobacterium kansasii]